VLDNLETSWERAGPPIEARLRDLLAIQGLALLASFRGQEAVGGARWTLRHRVDPLSDTDALTLFLDIADTIQPTDPDLPRFLQALGGVPLAICLTARRAAHHTTLAGLWADWVRLGPEVAVWAGTDPHRLTSVPHSIALSLQSSRMNPPAHRLFALLGQCPAGLAPADRIALLGTDATRAEEALIAVGLALHRADRLDLLPPVRDHARHTARPKGDDATSWCRHFLERACVEGARIFGDGGAEALAALTPEVANIDDALRAAPGLALREQAVAALYGIHQLLSASGAGSPVIFDPVAETCIAADDPRGQADALFYHGLVSFLRSDHATAQARYEEALPLYKRVSEVLGEANCIKSLGDIALARSDHPTAQARYEEARPLFQRVGDVRGEANCLSGFGDVALARSDHATAQARYEEARPRFRRVGDVLGEANCIQRLGDIARDRSDHATAQARYEEARPLFQRVGDVLGEANCLSGFGDVATATGDRLAAKAHYETALAMYERIHQTVNIALAHEYLAAVTAGAERASHVRTAKDTWLSIGLPDHADGVARRLDG